MEVGIPQTLSSLEKAFLPTSRLSLENNVLDVKLTDKDDEGEIMLLAMILLQLHGVKLPSSSSSSSSSSSGSVSDEDNDLINKKKRQRTSPDQLAILEQIFQTDKMPNQQTRVQLADQLGMSSRRVQIWFQNKRAKVKRSSMKQDGDCSSPSSLGDSSSSIPAPDSPSSSSESVSSPIPQSPNTSKAPDTPSIISAATLTSVVSSLTSKSTFTSSTSTLTNDTTLADTTKQLKAQQLFSLKAPFVETQPLLTSY